MRMYNAEWEAIKDFKHDPRCTDLLFDLDGDEIPADHGYALYQALTGILPWLSETPEAGVHPVHGAPTGRNENLVINRRVKLILRLPVERVAEAAALVGREIDLGTGRVILGGLKERALTPYATLYSPLVVLGHDDELEFLAEARAQLEKMDVRCGLIPGKKRKMRTPGGDVTGHSLMLHDVGLPQSLRVQEQGLGLLRGYGCGIFVPHKSIKEVAID